MKFRKRENELLTEIYRRLNYFCKGDVNEGLLLLALPSETKVLNQYDILKPYLRETPRTLNWYCLTEKGKKFFSHYTHKKRLGERENQRLFEGGVKNFDKSLLVE